MPKKPNNQQKALQERLATNLEKYNDDKARRAAILKKNAERFYLFFSSRFFFEVHE